MKQYKSFDDFHSDQLPGHQDIISALKDLVSTIRTDLDTSVKWGNGVWLLGDSPRLYVHCEKDHVQFGFFNGSALDDPENVLIGSGKYVRHIKIRSVDEINENILKLLIAQA